MAYQSSQSTRRGFLRIIAAAPYVLGAGRSLAQQDSLAQDRIKGLFERLDDNSLAARANYYSRSELFEIYKMAARAFGPELQKSLHTHAEREGLRSLAEISVEEYYNLARITQDNLSSDPAVRLISSLNSHPLTDAGITASVRLKQSLRHHLANDKIRTKKIKIEKGPLYIGDRRMPYFEDPELMLQQGLLDFGTYSASNAEIYSTEGSQESLKFIGGWIPRQYFGAKPGEYGKEIIAKDLNDKKERLKELQELVARLKPTTTASDLEKMLPMYGDSYVRLTLSELNLAEYQNLRGNGTHPPVTYQTLQRAIAILNRQIRNFDRLLSLK